MQNDAFCILPFTQIQIDHAPVEARPCCVFRFRKPILPTNYNHDPEIREVKQKMLAGIRPEQCQSCYQQEKNSGSSFRTSANASYPDLIPEIKSQGADYHRIQNLILITSNVCNLKCLPCEHGSFVRMKELNELGLLDITAKMRQNTDMTSYLELDFQRLTVSGGEPFYDNTWDFLSLLISTGRSHDVDLSINTNLTAVKRHHLDSLAENFRSVLILGSIDGVDTVNHYLRYPAEWADIERSVDMILATPGIDFMVTTALTNLALLRYPDLVRWMRQKGISQWYVTQVNQPSVLSCSKFFKIPNATLSDELQTLLVQSGLEPRSHESLEICLALSKHHDQDPKFINEIRQYLDRHDQRRGTSWTSVWPELRAVL